MNYLDKTKDELIKELQEFKQEYDSLKSSYLKDITRRKRVEELLKESIERLNEAQKLAHIGIWDWKPDTDTVTWTDELYRIAGLDPMHPAPTYKEHSSLYTPESWELLKTGVEKAMETGESYQFELELIRPNGDTRYVNAFGGAKYDSKGQVNGLFGTVQDITERKQTIAALVESEAKFRSLFKNSLLGISMAQPGGGLLNVNLAYARMYGYESPEALLAEVSDTTVLFANPRDRKEVIQVLSKYGFLEAKEFELIRKDGSRIFALVTAFEIRDSEGKLLFNMAAHIDITKHKKNEEKMKAECQYARNLIEVSLDPLLTINAEGKISDVNISTEKITGRTREKLIGSDFVDYFTEPDLVEKGYKIVYSKGVLRDLPLTILHKRGRSRDVLFNAALFKNEIGEIQGIFASARDITDRKKIEEELRKSKELFENLNQHLNDVRENERAVISREIHDELGQSMTALKLDLNRMYKYVNANPEAVLQLNSMIELVSDTIKDVQRISSDLRPGIIDDLGLVPAIEWYCEEFEKRTGIKCFQKLENSDYSNSKINLTFFRTLQESLTNVIRHAKASSVNIKLRVTQKGTILTIKDNGIGIPEEKIESHKSLGLIIMRERVRQLNGKIDISSKKGEGTKLTILIPFK